MKQFIFLVTSIFLFFGCASKLTQKEELYNKSASFWYKEIIKDIKMGTLDKADEAYTSLSSEHVASPLLKESLLILAKAHNKEEEYIMANYYIDEYTKRYASSKNISYLKYMKIKSNFQSFKRVNRDQKLLLDTINEANAYLKEYSHSPYVPAVQTILTRLQLTDQVLNQNIINLYKKTGKAKAAKIYEDKMKSSWLKNVKALTPKSGFFSKF
jgi:outer membrane protein assembly factor BamD